MAKGRTITQGDAKFLSDEFKKVFATKKDNANFLKKVIKEVSKLLVAQDIRNWGKMDELEEKFEKHTTKLKSDFLDEIDPILKEVATSREERPLIESRIKALEEIHPKGRHAIAS